jgi:hypothetical protein
MIVLRRIPLWGLGSATVFASSGGSMLSCLKWNYLLLVAFNLSAHLPAFDLRRSGAMIIKQLITPFVKETSWKAVRPFWPVFDSEGTWLAFVDVERRLREEGGFEYRGAFEDIVFTP